jgi:hypothetical protein
MAKIGMEKPISAYRLNSNNKCLSIELKPPKFPKNTSTSKKVYKNIFIRSNDAFWALYDIDTTIFIVTLLKEKGDPKHWIDKNLEEINRRLNEISR